MRFVAEWRSRLSGKRIERLARSSEPILAGPWTGSVTVELLYWIPLLTWLTGEAGVDAERVVAVSRGGVETWYADVAGEYRDVGESPWAPDDAAQLSPQLMAQVFAPYWEWGSLGPVRRYAVHRPLPDEPAGAAPPIATPYVLLACSFHAGFPDDEANRSFLAKLAGQLAGRANVALLDPPIGLDLPGEDISELCKEPRGLARVVRDSEALLAPFGAAACMGPLAGTPTLVFYSRGGFAMPHIHLLSRVARRLADDETPLFRARHVDSVEHVLLPAQGG